MAHRTDINYSDHASRYGKVQCFDGFFVPHYMYAIYTSFLHVFGCALSAL